MSRKQRIIKPPVSRSTFGFSTSVTRLRPVFLAILERLLADVGATLLADDARGEGDVLKASLSFHGFIFGLAHSAV